MPRRCVFLSHFPIDDDELTDALVAGGRCVQVAGRGVGTDGWGWLGNDGHAFDDMFMIWFLLLLLLFDDSIRVQLKQYKQTYTISNRSTERLFMGMGIYTQMQEQSETKQMSPIKPHSICPADGPGNSAVGRSASFSAWPGRPPSRTPSTSCRGYGWCPSTAARRHPADAGAASRW